MGAVAVYADGGVVGASRSTVAGMWAYCWVDDRGLRIRERSGVIPAGPDGFETVTNNMSEFMALLRGIEDLPEGWSGELCSDSRVTIGRFRDEWRLAGIPLEWRRRMSMALGRLGKVEFVRLDGHPTRKELAAGWCDAAKRGHEAPHRVSEHNRWCDLACTRAGELFVAARVTEEGKTAV